jgi:hypothetical protein
METVLYETSVALKCGRPQSTYKQYRAQAQAARAPSHGKGKRDRAATLLRFRRRRVQEMIYGERVCALLWPESTCGKDEAVALVFMW